jgi:HK97 family phage portal protein
MWPFSRDKAAPLAQVQIAPTVEKKESAIGQILFRQSLTMPQWPERDFAKLACEGYQQNPIVYACVWFTARAAAAVPIEIMRGEAEVDIPALRALLDHPNPVQDGPSFRQAVISDLLIAGECFTEQVKLITEKAPRELYRWAPNHVSPIKGEDGFIPKGWEFSGNGIKKTVQADFKSGIIPVLHVKDYHPTNEWRGMSPIDPAAFAIDVHTGVGRWNKALLENGGEPGGALVYAPKEGDATLSDDQFRRLKQSLKDTKPGEKMVLDGGMSWVQMGLSAKDMDFVEGKNAAARDIALCMGVPPLLLGIPGDNTFANYQEANKAFYRQTVLPLLGQWCRAMSWWIGPAFGPDIRIVPDIDDLEVFADERAAEWERVEASTVLTVNEKREKMGMAPIAGGDVVLVSSTMIPLEAAGSMPEGGAAPEDGGDSGDEGA